MRISQIDPLWQLDQQYVIECYELPDPNAKDATCKNKKYFGKKCRVKIFKSNKCLAAEGYSAVDKSWYDLKTAACDEQYRDKSQTFNLVNVNAEFTQVRHFVSAGRKSLNRFNRTITSSSASLVIQRTLLPPLPTESACSKRYTSDHMFIYQWHHFPLSRIIENAALCSRLRCSAFLSCSMRLYTFFAPMPEPVIWLVQSKERHGKAALWYAASWLRTLNHSHLLLSRPLFRYHPSTKDYFGAKCQGRSDVHDISVAIHSLILSDRVTLPRVLSIGARCYRRRSSTKPARSLSSPF